ncbi:MAG: hypothetical protein K0S49_1894, partial [Microbacterium sp.]|nr:hypothetical protein [Microbacterium sp.]
DPCTVDRDLEQTAEQPRRDVHRKFRELLTRRQVEPDGSPTPADAHGRGAFWHHEMSNPLSTDTSSPVPRSTMWVCTRSGNGSA